MTDDWVPERFVRRKEVLRLIGISEFTLWRWAKDGLFPQPYQLNPNSTNGPVAWKESEIQAWMESRPSGFGKGIKAAHEARRKRARSSEI